MNLPPEDNLRKEGKSSAPKVSFIRRFHCTILLAFCCPWHVVVVSLFGRESRWFPTIFNSVHYICTMYTLTHCMYTHIHWQELRSFSITLNIEPKYHPNIIGRKGATINKIRDDHGVRIQLPDKESSNSDEIVVTGYEHQVNSAQEDILKIVRELVCWIVVTTCFALALQYIA